MDEKQSNFEELCVPHLDVAYHLAYLLVGRDMDAQDVVQEATSERGRGLKDFAEAIREPGC